MLRTITAAALAAATAVALAAPPASAAEPSPVPIAEGLAGPLSVARDLDGSTYVTENFGGTLKKIARGKPARTLYSSAVEDPDFGPNEVGAVSAAAGVVTFAETTPTGALLKRIGRHGKVSTIADLGAFEAKKNPDGAVTYGAPDLPAACADQFEGLPASYTGEAFSHPYATVGGPLGTFVADAGANSILYVSPRGRIHTVAVLPAATLTITPELIASAATSGLTVPECAIGEDYAFEGVPTDVELGPGGWLYVTSLPGGPEDPSLGARGLVFRINPFTGKVVKVAEGFSGATNLAVSPRGDVYVAELYADTITKVTRRGERSTFVSTSTPAGIEWTRAGLLATGGIFGPNGTVTLFRW